MSILGVKKKKHIDNKQLNEIEKEILKIKSELLTMGTKDKYLYNSANTLNLRVLDIENIVNNIKDKKIMTIFAGIDGGIYRYQDFNFGEGGPYYAMNFPGNIISISLISIRNKNIDVSINIAINTTQQQGYGIELQNETHGYYSFNTPLKVKAGDVISVNSLSENLTCISTLVSLIIEIDI